MKNQRQTQLIRQSQSKPKTTVLTIATLCMPLAVPVYLTEKKSCNIFLTQFFDTFCRADNIGHAYAEFLIHYHHFAVCNESAVDQHVERFTGKAIQFNNRALVELQ